jgi:hypothetical protein
MYPLAIEIEMDRPEYFVVRVYRRQPGCSPEVEGVVEVVASHKQRAFASAQALWAILLEPPVANQRLPGADPGGRNLT